MAKKLPRLIYVCRILKPHGVKGAFKVELLSDDPERLRSLRKAYLVHPKDEGQRFETVVSLASRHPESLLLYCDRITSREAVEAYRFWYLAVDRTQARPLPEGEYYVCDLLGCHVFDEKYGDLGTVKEIDDRGGQNRYVVTAPHQKDLYFPAVEELILKTDLEGRRIDVRLPEGLYELYRS